VLTPELCAVIAERKPDLLAALRDAAPTSNVATEPRRSARPLADAWAQTEQAAQHAIILDADRAALLDWALANGCPPLEIHPWATVVGTAHGWQKFVRWGSADDIAAALVAAGLHHPERLLAPEQT
jgi:hypothetical protein